MGRYRKIDPRFWKDEKVRSLRLKEKTIALYCFTAQSNRVGLFSFSPGEACEDLALTTETFAKAFGVVSARLKFGWDSAARVLYLPTWWKYNCPENPNVLMYCLNDLDEVPHTSLFQLFKSNIIYLPATFHVTFAKCCSKSYLQPSPNQEQEQEQEQERRTGTEGGPGETTPAPPSATQSPPNTLPGLAPAPAKKKSRRTAALSLEQQARFDIFWTHYPKKFNKQDAMVAWNDLEPKPNEALLLRMLDTLKWQRQSPDWTRDKGAAIPYPATWLRAQRWTDEPPTPVSGGGPSRPAPRDAWAGMTPGEVTL